jgi:hypothetical protein
MMMLGSGEEGAGVEHVRHHRKTSRKFTKLLRVLEEEESPTWLIKPMRK